MSARLGLGVIGAGAFGRFVSQAVADVPGLAISAVADVDLACAAALANKHGARAVADWPALLDDPSVHVVVVATPPATHAAVAIRALTAGRHVFCEKPLATNVADAELIRAAVASSGAVLVVDHVLRYNPLLRLLALLRETGVLGPVEHFTFDNDAADEGLGPDHWFWDESISGGIFIEHGVHFFDACHLLMGSRPESVVALHGSRPDGRVDSVVAATRHPGGALATFAHAFTHPQRCERQLMRLDFGCAEARIHGWIPVRAGLDVWTDDAGLQTLAAMPGRAAELLAVPGFHPSGAERIEVAVTRDAGPSHARSRDVIHHVPHYLDIKLDLGGGAAKGRVYAQSVRAAMHDLVECVGSGRRPVAGAEEGCSSVAVAEAARRSATQSRTIDLTWPAPALPESLLNGVAL